MKEASVPGVLAAATGSDWSSGGSLLTFYFPVGLFIVVAVSLYLELSRPHAIPGRKPLAAGGTARQAEDAAIPPPSQAGSSSPDEEHAAGPPDDHGAPAAGP
jgi:ribose/xylose/arabinose/galactoside ABC-type transport system permease subunit